MLLGGGRSDGGGDFQELHAVSSEIILVWGQVSEELLCKSVSAKTMRNLCGTLETSKFIWA